MLEKQEFIAKMQDLANIMGYTLDVSTEINERRATLKNGIEEVVIYGSSGWAKAGQLNIFGDYPRTKDGRLAHSAAASINVSEKKTAEQISKDIARRFLPEYRATLQKAIEQIQDIDDREAKARADIDRMIAEIPGAYCQDPYSSRHGTATRSHVYVRGSYGNKIEIARNSGGLHGLTLQDLTTDQVIQIMNSIKK